MSAFDARTFDLTLPPAARLSRTSYLLRRSILNPSGRLRPLAVAVAFALGAAELLPASAQAESGVQAIQKDYDLPAGPLATTLNQIAREAGLALTIDATTVGEQMSAPVQGHYSAQDALRQALKGTGLELVETDAGTYTLRPADGAHMLAPVMVSADGGEVMTLSAVTVTGRSDLSADPAGLKADYQGSATKSQQSLRETPQAITVVTKESIEKRQARDITSALELTAGLVPSENSTIGGPFAGRGLEPSEQFSLRGQTLNAQRDIRVDGFAMSSPQLDLALFERIEVVKGPSSTLYGQGSVGGFINFVRKKPQAERATSVAGQIGSWDTYRAELDTTGALDDDAEVRGRFIAVYDDADSFIEGVWTKSSVLAPSVEWQLGEQTRLLVDVLYQDDVFVPSHGIPLRVVNGNELRIPDIPRSRFIGAPSVDDSISRTTLGNARLDHELSDRWLATLAMQKGKQKFARYFDNYGHGGLSPDGDTNLYADTYSTDDDFWAGELRLDGHFDAFGREHQLLLGVERNQRRYDSTFAYQLVGVGNIYTGEFPTDGTRGSELPVDLFSGFLKNAGTYAQTLLSVSERTKLLAGLRYDRAEQSSGDDELTSDATTMRVGVTHEMSQNVTAYASYGESFSPVEALTYDNKLLEPERGSGYEVGLKTEWNERKMGVTVALYRQDLDNRPIPDPDPSHQAQNPDGSISAGLQRAHGIEIEFAGSPAPGVEIAAGFGWADSNYEDKQDPAYGLVPYGFIGRNAGIFAGYEWQNGALEGFGAGITYTYIGKRSFAYAGLVDLGFVNGATSDQLWFEGFDRTDLNFSYNAIPNWDLSLQIRNVFDQTYIERMRDIESNNYFGSPRALLFRAEYDF